MQKIITDKKPFVTERTEKLVITDEAMYRSDSPLAELVMPLAKDKGVPEGLMPIQLAHIDNTQMFVFVWFEVLL